MAMMNGAQFLAQTLAAYDVSHVFFVPAVLTPALAEMERVGVKPIMAHSEKSAAYMADGYARMRGGPGVCFSQSVGAANLAAGLQDAYLALSPVVAITGRRPPEWRYRHSYQEIQHMPLYEPVTKYNVQADSIGELPSLLRQAFRAAVSGAPAPTHVEIPGISGDVLINTEADLDVFADERFKSVPPFRSFPDPSDIGALADLLARAERPVIVAGGGVTHSGAGAELLALIEKLNIPLAYALNAKGQVPDNHPLNVGLVGAYSRRSANRVVFEADTVIYIGSRTGSQATNDWKIPGPGTKIVQIDVDPEELGRNYPNAASVLGDARESLRKLLAAVSPVPARDTWLGRVNEIVGEWTAEFEPHWLSDAVPMQPERLCKEISAALPTDGAVVVDTGHSALWAGMYLDINKPGQRFIRCAGSLGWAFPASLGVKCAAPDKPVVCFTGDGGFWYHLTELETALNAGINTVTVVNDNRSFSQTQRGVQNAFADVGGGEKVWKFTDVDFAGIAQEMGAIGMLVTRPEELPGAIEAALKADRPVVIDAKSDTAALAPPPWS